MARQLPVVLMAAFGVLALLLASIGVYAMFANMAVAREREFGLRLALGSRPNQIAGLMLQQGIGWMLVGLAGGALGTTVLLSVLRRLLEEVPPIDFVAVALALVLMLGTALVGLIVPVRRAARVDPLEALRYE